MIQGSTLSYQINNDSDTQCQNIYVFHESFLNISNQSCRGSEIVNILERNPKFIIFAIYNGIVIFIGLHIATKIGCSIKSEWMYFFVVRILESTKYFTITFFKVFLMNNSPIQYCITQVIKVVSIVNLPLQYVPIQKGDFIMSSLFQVNLQPATLSYTAQGMRFIQEQNMRDTWYFLIIEQIDNFTVLLFYFKLLCDNRNTHFLTEEYYFLAISVIAQIINLATIIHTWHLLQKYGPTVTLNITKPNPCYQEVEQLQKASLKVITQQVKLIIKEEQSEQNNDDNFLINIDIIKMMFRYSNLYDMFLSYTDRNNNTVIFEIFSNIRKLLISTNNYKYFEDHFNDFEQIYLLACKNNHQIEFNRYNNQAIKKQDEFRIFKFKFHILKITYPKHVISISFKKNVFNKQEFLTTMLIEKYVASCHQVVAFLKAVESFMDFNPKCILYDLQEFT